MTYEEKILADMDEAISRMKRNLGFVSTHALAAREKQSEKVASEVNMAQGKHCFCNKKSCTYDPDTGCGL